MGLEWFQRDRFDNEQLHLQREWYSEGLRLKVDDEKPAHPGPLPHAQIHEKENNRNLDE